MEKPTRREVLLRGVSFVSAVSLLPLAGRAQSAEPACVLVDSEPLRESLSYADPAPDPAKSCLVCGFFTAKGGAGCGACMIMIGPVNVSASCESWRNRSG